MPFVAEDDDVSVWMFAMIGIGCVFIVFVAVSIYLMWYVTRSIQLPGVRGGLRKKRGVSEILDLK